VANDVIQVLIAQCAGSVLRAILTSGLPLSTLRMLPDVYLRSGYRSTELFYVLHQYRFQRKGDVEKSKAYS
jgi:hypothetical protein